MIELYHNAMSTCAQKIRLALAEKALDWVGHHLDLRAGDQQAPAYLALNPRGVVPTLIDDGRVVRESNVILEYLDDVWPDPPLRPADAYRRARVRLWNKRLDEGHHDLATATLSMGVAFRYQYLEKGRDVWEALVEKIPDPIKRARRRALIDEGLDAEIFRVAIGMWARLLDDMEAALGADAWLAGPEYGIADIAYTPYLTRLEHLNLTALLDRRPNIAAWYGRVKDRASYGTAIGEWNDPEYLSLMAAKGEEAWPKIAAMIDGSR